VIGLVWATNAGNCAAQRLAAAWPGECALYSGPVGEQLTRAWAQSRTIVAFLATGATIRLAAPLLRDKRSDPGVVCVDETGRYAIALLGGHSGDANETAERVARVLGAQPVLTTGSDSAGIPGLDALGFAVANPKRLAEVSRAVLDGEPVALRADAVWPLPALPGNVGDFPAARHRLVITDRLPAGDDALVLHPPSLVLGIGASRGAPESEIASLVETALGAAGLAAESVRGIATIDVKASEPGLVAFADRRNLPITAYPAAALARVEVPNPSETVRQAVGTPSVAEAAALLAAGSPGDTLVVPKQASQMATVAVARLRPRGRLAIVGIGPGATDLRAPRATDELRRASVVVGLDRYMSQIKALLRPGTRIVESGLGAEEQRAREAIALAKAGNAVALIGSGDAGVYAMASPTLELADESIDIVVVPGITAALAASALLGAPLGHDHAYVSLSDLHTPWEVIERRLDRLAEADIVVCLYNPRSSRRTRQLTEALAILGKHRPGTVPVGIVRDATRPGQRVVITNLAELDPSDVDMNTVVIVGSSVTRVVSGRLVTPRGYGWMAG
jgi:cobalt-precorrin 5A hydrolase / precorrin-3B C17-methyltransferase